MCKNCTALWRKSTLGIQNPEELQSSENFLKFSCRRIVQSCDKSTFGSENVCFNIVCRCKKSQSWRQKSAMWANMIKDSATAAHLSCRFPIVKLPPVVWWKVLTFTFSGAGHLIFLLLGKFNSLYSATWNSNNCFYISPCGSLRQEVHQKSRCCLKYKFWWGSFSLKKGYCWLFRSEQLSWKKNYS